MKKIKIGQIGIGHNHASAKMRTVRYFPELFDIVGIAEPNEKWIAERGKLKEYEGVSFVSEEQLLEECDAILVETAVPLLDETAQRCIDAGKHIHLDKPAGENYAEYEKLMNAAKAKSLIVQLGYMYRYNPAVLKTLELVRSGELGEITSMNIEMSTDHPDEYRGWLAQYKGGSMYIFGSHLIDLAMLVMGKAPDDVYSFNKETGKNGVYSKDNCFSVLDFGTALAKITNNSTEINGWGRRQLVVCGTKGTVEIKPLEVPTIMSYVNEKSTPGAYTDNTSRVDVESVPDSHRYDTMLIDFYKMCVGEAENPYSYDYELSLHKVILKACNIEI